MVLLNGVNLKAYNFVVQNVEGRGAPPLSHSAIELAQGSYVSAWRFEERTITIEGVVWGKTPQEAKANKDALVRLFSQCVEPCLLTFLDTGRSIRVRLKGEPIVLRTIGPVFASAAYRVTVQFVATEPFFEGQEEHNEQGTGYVKFELFAPLFLAGDPGVIVEAVSTFGGGEIEFRNNLFDITKASAGLVTPAGVECWNNISGLPSSPAVVNFNTVFLKNNTRYTLYIESRPFTSRVCQSVKAGNVSLCGEVSEPVFTHTFTFTGNSGYYTLSIDVTGCRTLFKRVVLVEEGAIPQKDLSVKVKIPPMLTTSRIERGLLFEYSTSGASTQPVADMYKWLAPGVWYALLPSQLRLRLVGKRRYLEG